MADAKLTTFHCFPLLPAELRVQIWNLVLLEEPEASLFTYKQAAWDSLIEQLSDENFDIHRSVEISYRERFHDNMLGLTFMEIPLAHVNHEARKIAIKWTNSKNNELGVRLITTSTQPLRRSFVRPFLSTQDIVFVASHIWDAFVGVPHVMNYYCGHTIHGLFRHISEIERLAVPEEMLLQERKVENFIYVLGLDVLSLRELIIVPANTINPNLTINLPKIGQYWKLVKSNLTEDKLSRDIMKEFADATMDICIKVLRARETPSIQGQSEDCSDTTSNNSP